MRVTRFLAQAAAAWRERSARFAVAGRRVALGAADLGRAFLRAHLAAFQREIGFGLHAVRTAAANRSVALWNWLRRSLKPAALSHRLAVQARAALSPAMLGGLGLIGLGGLLILIRPALVAGGLLLGLDLMLPEPRAGVSAAAEQPEPPTPRLVGIPRPVEIFDVPHPDRRAQPPQHEAFRHPLRLLRRDRFTFGEANDPSLFLVVAITREPGAGVGELSLGDQVAEVLKIERARLATTGRPLPMPTKLGDVSVADAVLAGGEAARACLAFVLRHGEVAFDMAGLACGAASRPVDRMYLRCFVERITLNGAGLDQPLQALFQGAEKRRDPACDGPSRILAAGHKPTWLDSASTIPKLKALSETPKKRTKRREKRKHSR